MKKNIGSIDRAARIMIALVIAALYFTAYISGTVAIVLLVLAGVFILTSFISFCPIYFTFGLSTRNNELKKVSE